MLNYLYFCYNNSNGHFINNKFLFFLIKIFRDYDGLGELICATYNEGWFLRLSLNFFLICKSIESKVAMCI